MVTILVIVLLVLLLGGGGGYYGYRTYGGPGLGGVLGLVFGLTDQWMFSLVSGDMMNFAVHFRPSPTALVFTIGALAISLLGSVPPARRAARLNIIDAVGVD